jgi:hypothetical protein
MRKLADTYDTELKNIQFAYDGKSNLYTTKPLPMSNGKEVAFEVEYLDPSETALVTYTISKISYFL